MDRTWLGQDRQYVPATVSAQKTAILRILQWFTSVFERIFPSRMAVRLLSEMRGISSE